MQAIHRSGTVYFKELVSTSDADTGRIFLVLNRLKREGFLESPDPGAWRLTDEGETALDELGSIASEIPGLAVGRDTTADLSADASHESLEGDAGPAVEQVSATVRGGGTDPRPSGETAGPSVTAVEGGGELETRRVLMAAAVGVVAIVLVTATVIAVTGGGPAPFGGAPDSPTGTSAPEAAGSAETSSAQTLTPLAPPPLTTVVLPAEADLPPGVTNGKVVDNQGLVEAHADLIGERRPLEYEVQYVSEFAPAFTNGQTAFERYEGNASYTFSWRNDSERELFRIDRADTSGFTAFYLPKGPDGMRSPSGEVQYGQGDGQIESEAAQAFFFGIVPNAFVNSLEWKVTGTETIDGEQFYLIKANAVNETAVNEVPVRNIWGHVANEFQSVDAALLVRADGLITDGAIRATLLTNDGEPFDVVITFSVSDSEDITVEPPGWYDESEASSGG